MLKSNIAIAIIVNEWNHQLHSRRAKCPVHLILIDFVILKFIAQYTMKSSLRWVCFAFVYKVVYNAHETGFSRTFAKVRKEIISFVVFVWLYTWDNSAPTGQIFMKFVEYLSKNCQENSRFAETWQEKWALLMKTYEHFMIITRWILLRMRNVSDKICRKDQNTHFVFKNFFPLSKIVPFMR
jgi:hypothetical protein